MRLRVAVVIVGLALQLFSGAARASYIISIQQTGADVSVTGGGSLNLNGLQLEFTGLPGSGGFIASEYDLVDVDIGPNIPFSEYGGNIIGQYPYGSNEFTNSTQDNGSIFVNIGDEVGVPAGYVSGTILPIAMSIYDNTTISQLGLVTGTYTVNLPQDTIEYFVGVPAPPIPSTVPIPSSAPMFGVALLALGVASYGLGRKGAATA